MKATTASLSLIKIDEEISREQAALANATADAIARIVALVAKRERLVLAAQVISGIHDMPKKVPLAEPFKKITAPVLILDALRQSPGGLTGERLHEIGRGAGISKSAIDRTRSRLRNAGKVETRDAIWFSCESSAPVEV